MRDDLEHHDQPADGTGGLSGRGEPRVLVVEDNAVIGLDLETSLRHDGFEVVGVVVTPMEAMERAGKDGFDVVLLDLDLGGQPTFAVADMLAGRGIPFVFVSGYDQASLPAAHAGRPFLQKPFSFEAMATVLRLVAKRSWLPPTTAALDSPSPDGR